MKNRILIVLIISSWFTATAQPEHLRWSYPTGARVLSHPVVAGDRVFIGSTGQDFYCLDASTGEVHWRFNAGNSIFSSAIVEGGLVFFESGNTCFALNQETGEKAWSYYSGDPDGSERLDPWDYHKPSPVADDSMVYFPCGDGRIYGLDRDSGIPKVQVETLDSAAVRSTPVIQDGVMYFGDRNGIVYGYAIEKENLLWSTRTFDTLPYPTFGHVNTRMLVHDTLLIFGARNPEIKVLSTLTGTVVWSYAVEGGGWISGDPLVEGDVLYIGGSDCHRMFAFDVYSGRLLWSYQFLNNNFAQPVIAGDNLLFTSGNAYAYQDNNYGTGYLYALDKYNGSIKNFELIGGNLFTTPVFAEGNLILGSSDGNVYAIDSAAFVNDPADLAGKGYRAVRLTKITPAPFRESLQIEYEMEYTAPVLVRVLGLDGQVMAVLDHSEMGKGTHQCNWNGQNEAGETAPAGYYSVEITSGQYKVTDLIRKEE